MKKRNVKKIQRKQQSSKSEQGPWRLSCFYGPRGVERRRRSGRSEPGECPEGVVVVANIFSPGYSIQELLTISPFTSHLRGVL